MLLAVCVRSYVKTGDRVVVCDLLDGVELNGCSGVVEAWLPDSEATADDGGRWRVRVRSRTRAAPSRATACARATRCTSSSSL